jgi:hypothetical protein
MALIKYDVSSIENETDRGVMPAGVYKVKIITCVDAKPSGKDRRLEVVGEVVEGDWKGYKVFDYINLEVEDMAWKLAQFVRALGLPDKGGLDPKKVVGLLTRSRTKVTNSDDYGMQSKHQRWLPLDADEAESTGDDESADDEDATEDDDAEDDSQWTQEELKALALKELTTLATEAELDVKEITKGKTKAADKKNALVEAILASQSEDDEDTDDEDGDEDELWTEDELGELEDDDLKALLSGDPEDDEDEGFGLDPADYTKTVTKAGKKRKVFDSAAAIAAILEAQEGGDDEDAEADEEDEEEATEDEAVDYDSMDPAELKALCKERNLKTQGTKKILVARLKKADEPV